MSQGCLRCGFAGGAEAEHVEHAHRLVAELAQRVKDQATRYENLRRLLTMQKKNRIILELSGQVGALKREAANLRRALEAKTEERLAGAIGGKGGE